MRRKYNQAGLLASYIHQQTNVPFYPTMLKRTRATSAQGSKNKVQRYSNVKGAFALSEEGLQRIPGKTWCVVDDVLTSGATASACAQLLMDHGATTVYVVTIARTPLNSYLDMSDSFSV